MQAHRRSIQRRSRQPKRFNRPSRCRRDRLEKSTRRELSPVHTAGSVDQDDIYAFLGAYARHHEIVKNGERVAHLQAGDSGWTLPIPIEKISKGWQFDLRQAHDEMADRRVGRNELSAIQTVLAIGDAQRDFAQAQGSTVYAQRFVSRPGKRDGLYWPIADNEPESPLGALAAVMNPNAPRARLITAITTGS